MSFFSHPTAIIDPAASIGANTKVWHFCHVMAEARIGDNCILGQNCFVGSEVSIGSGVKIQNNVSIYQAVTLEDDVFVGPSVVFTNVLTPRAFINRKSDFSPTHVGKGASIGANATIVCGNQIGQYAMIAAGAVVTHDVQPYELVGGIPARAMGWVSKAGRRLHFDKEGFARCPENQDLYQLVESMVRMVP